MEKFKFNKRTSELFNAILLLKTVNEVERFFRDLCTIDELGSMSERWEIARSLEKGLPYREISEKLGASTTTVTRVSQWLKNGMGGYRLVLDRIASHHNPSFGKKS